MSIVNVKKCDVYGTAKNVRTYQLVVTMNDTDGDPEMVTDKSVDLSDRALTRLLAFIERGASAPGGE